MKKLLLELKFLLLYILMLFSIVLGCFSLLNLQKSDSFQIKNVKIIGVENFPKDDILKEMSNFKGKVINTENDDSSSKTVSLLDIKTAIDNVPWVKNAMVRFEKPNSIVLKIEEKIPAAIWPNNGNYFLLEKDGSVIDYPVEYKKGHYLLITNKNPPSDISEIFDILNANPYIKNKTVSAEHISNRRFNIVIENFGNDILIKLPEKNPNEALKNIENLDRKSDLLKRNINEIDARTAEYLIR